MRTRIKPGDSCVCSIRTISVKYPEGEYDDEDFIAAHTLFNIHELDETARQLLVDMGVIYVEHGKTKPGIVELRQVDVNNSRPIPIATASLVANIHAGKIRLYSSS